MSDRAGKNSPKSGREYIKYLVAWEQKHPSNNNILSSRQAISPVLLSWK